MVCKICPLLARCIHAEVELHSAFSGYPTVPGSQAADERYYIKEELVVPRPSTSRCLHKEARVFFVSIQGEREYRILLDSTDVIRAL